MTRWFWLPTHAFWRKFCGVSDEYEILKNRWNTLSEEFKKALPPLRSNKNGKGTFALLDELLSSLNDWFNNIALFRDKSVQLKEVLPRLVADYGKLEQVNQSFFDFCTYVGLIKHAFFQRTVSLEIPQFESAVPHSPERTTGNEMFYVAADCLAAAYSNCVHTPEIKWDGFITFMPAIGEEGFYGAFFRPSALLKLFHISMSEEQKYFLGTYLALAHEFGHAAIVGGRPIADLPVWYKVLYARAMQRTKKYLSKYRKSRTCRDCEMKSFEDPALNLFHRKTFEDFIADVFALRIGGVNTALTLLDLAPSTDMSIIRSSALLRYMADEGFSDSIIDPLKGRVRDIRKSLKALLPPTIPDVGCIQCWSRLGEIWASSVRQFIEFFSLDPISANISKEFDHNYRSVNKEYVKKALVDGEALADVDPRAILSVYYDLVSENKRPNYSATVYSIVYNRNLRTSTPEKTSAS